MSAGLRVRKTRFYRNCSCVYFWCCGCNTEHINIRMSEKKVATFNALARGYREKANIWPSSNKARDKKRDRTFAADKKGQN